MPKLNSHGVYKMWAENQIIHIESSGPWNVEYFHELHKELFELVTTINAKPYALLISIIGTGVPVKEGIEVHKEFVKLGNASAVAIDISKCATQSLTQKLFSDVYSSIHLNYKFCSNKETAQLWLNEALAD